LAGAFAGLGLCGFGGVASIRFSVSLNLVSSSWESDMPDKLPYLSDDHHYALAALATRSSQMEHMIEWALSAAMIETPSLAEYVLKNLGADRIVGALEAAYLDLLGKDDHEVIAIAARIRRIRNERNEMLHWIYGAASDPKLAKLATLRPYREPRVKELTADDFHTVAAEMLTACTELHILMERGRQRLESRRKPLPQVPLASLVSSSPKGLAEMFAPPHPQQSSPDSSEPE
jgi:hypothetical protein